MFEQFITEGMFLTYDEITPGDFDRFVEAYKELHAGNEVVYDKTNNMTWGMRKGSKQAHWKYDHNSYRLLHSEKNREVLGLVNFKKAVSKGHTWSK